MKSAGDFSQKIENLKQAIDTPDTIIIGVGFGLSTAAGTTYDANVLCAIFRIFIKVRDSRYLFRWILSL